MRRFEAIQSGWDGCVSPIVEKIARCLCECDGGYNPDCIVMGHPREKPFLVGYGKQITPVSLPLRPLWTCYISDARRLIGVFEKEGILVG